MRPSVGGTEKVQWRRQASQVLMSCLRAKILHASASRRSSRHLQPCLPAHREQPAVAREVAHQHSAERLYDAALSHIKPCKHS